MDYYSNRMQTLIEELSRLPGPMPSWKDRLDAQVTYTAMMTDTLLEEV